jgi:thiol-disulfide isomerase/thioredoxin
MKSTKRYFVYVICSGLAAVALCMAAFVYAQSGGSDFRTTMRTAAKLLRWENNKEAISAYKDAIRLSSGKDYAPYWGLAQAYNGLDDTKNVLATCDQMLALAPNDAIRAQCHRLKGLALLKDGMIDKSVLAQAEAEFRQALDLDSLYTEVHMELGLTLLLDGHIEDCVAELKSYIQADPDGEEAELAQKIVDDPNGAKSFSSLIRSAIIVGQANGNSDKIDDSDAPPGPADSGDSSKYFRMTQGGPAPSMEFTTIQKQKISTASLRGKVVLLDFWATWCPACRAAIPELGRMFSENDKNKFVLISISVDEKEDDWRQFVGVNHMDWIQARDPQELLVHKLLVDGGVALPSYFVIDGKGNLHQYYDGWGPGQRRRIQAAVNQWMAELPGGK